MRGTFRSPVPKRHRTFWYVFALLFIEKDKYTKQYDAFAFELFAPFSLTSALGNFQNVRFAQLFKAIQDK